MIMFICSEIEVIFSLAYLRPVPDLLPIEYQDSIPGNMAWKSFLRSRCTFFSVSIERLLSAMNRILPSGTASSITLM